MTAQTNNAERQVGARAGLLFRVVFLFVFVPAGFASLGCETTTHSGEVKLLVEKLEVKEKEVRGLTKQVEALTAENADQKKRIQTLSGLGEKRMEKLCTVEKIEIDRRSGGLDTDKKPGHDVIKLFLLPKDASGDTIKAAGEIKIQLFDLAGPEGENLFAEYAYDAEQAAEHFTAGMFAYHYSFDLTWPNPPAHSDLTLRVTFTDYLTGKTHAAQKLVQLKLPPK
jgi:hypothetical protein